MSTMMVTQRTLFDTDKAHEELQPMGWERVSTDPEDRDKVLRWLDEHTDPPVGPSEDLYEEWRQSQGGEPYQLKPQWWWEHGFIAYAVLETASVMRVLRQGVRVPKDIARLLGISGAPAQHRHPTILAYGPVLAGLEGISMFTERTGITRTDNRAPHVTTANGGLVSIGASLGTVLDVNEEAAAFAASLKLSDDTAAGFVLGLARWCDRANRRDRASYVVVTVVDYCQARGWKKHHKGGYKPEHKEKARQEMLRLNNVWVQHTVPEHMRRGKDITYVTGQLMHVAVESTDASGKNPTAFRMSPGTWATDYLSNNPNCTALVLQNVLQIDTRKSVGQMAQRLGIYMALTWRTKFLHNNADQSHCVGNLLRVLGIDPATITHREERRRTRDHLEEALQKLQDARVIGTRDDADGLVTGWEYANPEAGDPDAPDDWASWLRWTVRIPAPPEVRDFYDVPRLAREERIKERQGYQRRQEKATMAAIARHHAERAESDE